MSKKLRATKPEDLIRIQNAIACLKVCRTTLRSAGAPQAAEAVGRAIKSTEGAARHIRGVLSRRDSLRGDEAMAAGLAAIAQKH